MEIKFTISAATIVKNYLLETPVGWIALDTGYRGGCRSVSKAIFKACTAQGLEIHLFNACA